MPVIKIGAMKIQGRQNLILAEGVRKGILEVGFTVEFKGTDKESSRRWKFQVEKTI